MNYLSPLNHLVAWNRFSFIYFHWKSSFLLFLQRCRLLKLFVNLNHVVLPPTGIDQMQTPLPEYHVLKCSLILVEKDLPVWPIFILTILYTPFCFSLDIAFLLLKNRFFKVLLLLKAGWQSSSFEHLYDILPKNGRLVYFLFKVISRQPEYKTALTTVFCFLFKNKSIKSGLYPLL